MIIFDFPLMSLLLQSEIIPSKVFKGNEEEVKVSRKRCENEEQRSVKFEVSVVTNGSGSSAAVKSMADIESNRFPPLFSCSTLK